MVKRFVSIFLVVVAFSMFCLGAIAESPSSEVEVASSTSENTDDIIEGIINANNVVLREGPTRETVKIASFSQGTKVNIIVGSEVENQDEFGTRIKVKFGELEGYIAKRYVIVVGDNGDEWYLLSSSMTKAGTNSNRDVNISIASSYINGKILQPNEKFSFWETVGKCTYDKGYKDATVYSNGKKTQGIGGGVCQVATTLNMAVKSAGITTNARQHSLPVSYASREDEATVSFGNTDFKFTNTTGKTIMIVMKTGEGSCTCEIWGKVSE